MFSYSNYLFYLILNSFFRFSSLRCYCWSRRVASSHSQHSTSKLLNRWTFATQFYFHERDYCCWRIFRIWFGWWKFLISEKTYTHDVSESSSWVHRMNNPFPLMWMDGEQGIKYMQRTARFTWEFSLWKLPAVILPLWNSENSQISLIPLQSSPCPLHQHHHIRP